MRIVGYNPNALVVQANTTPEIVAMGLQVEDATMEHRKRRRRRRRR